MSGYGSNADGEFNPLTKAYKEDPSIDLYVKLRRENPNAEIEISFIGGMESLFFMEPELRKFGFDPDLVASVMDADSEAITELSLQIMEKMILSKARSRAGETHLSRRGLVVPDKLINWLIAYMMEGLSWNDNLYIPRDLIVLIRERLSGSNPEYKHAALAHEMRGHAITIGGQLMARGVMPTFRMLARILGVAPSTVKRWFPAGDFVREVKRASSQFDEKGQPKPFGGLRTTGNK